MAFQVVAHAAERLGKFADGAVGMDIEDIEVFARAVFHDHIGVGQQRRKRVAADCDRQLRIGGLETEGGGFQRRRVIPGGFEGKADVLLVPELPDGHLTPEMFRRLLGEPIGRGEVDGEFALLAPDPLRGVMVHAENLDAALGEQVGVGLVLQPVVLAGNSFHFGPVQPFAHHPEPGAAGGF